MLNPASLEDVHLRFTLVVLIAFSPSLLFGQRVSFGFVGGTNLTRDFPLSQTRYLDVRDPSGLTTYDLYSDGHRFVAGASVEVDFAKGFSLEASALHRSLQLKQRYIYPNGERQEVGSFSAGTWEWPLLLKYRLPSLGAVRPFVEAGPSFRTWKNPTSPEPAHVGGTVGVGAELRAGRFRVSPTVRYTRWQGEGDYSRLASKRDQIEFVTAFSYATSVPSWRLRGRKLRFGLIGGTPFTGGLQEPPSPQRQEEAQGYLGGLVIEAELTRRLGVEVNGLYRPFRADLVSPVVIAGAGPQPDSRFEFTVVTWQIPVLAKYRLCPDARLRPVVEAGPSFRLSGNRNGSQPSNYGFTAGVGVETSYQALKLTPVLRYTHWAADANRFSFSPRTAPNQVELLVSFTF